jgi:hypothetical protein
VIVPRLTLVATLVVGTGLSASAQSPAPGSSIGLPLPPIGLPLPTIGLPPQDVQTTAPPRVPDGKPRHQTPPTIVVFGAPYGWGVEPWQRSPVPGAIVTNPSTGAEDFDPEVRVDSVAAVETGRLELDIRPRQAQVFVDGDFVGTWSDLDGELTLSPGTHRIEIRLAQHEALAFDARIVAGRTITYQGVLTPLQPAPNGRKPDPAAAPDVPSPQAKTPRAVQTFYLIPGCYLGNVPPQEVKLAPGCEQRQVITHRPGQ